MASMAASCELFARHCHHNHWFLAVYDSHHHLYLVNLFYRLRPSLFSSRHPVGRAELQHILLIVQFENCKLWALHFLFTVVTVSGHFEIFKLSEGNDNNLHEEAYPGRRNFFPDQFPEKFKMMHHPIALIILVSFVAEMFRMLQLFWKCQQDYKDSTLCGTVSQKCFHFKWNNQKSWQMKWKLT